jgi:hypothetical protein
MEKSGNSREERNTSHGGTSQGQDIISPRVSIVSPRISGIDFHVADGFHRVSPPESDDEEWVTQRRRSPIRRSILKEASDESIAGPSRSRFDPNTSRFERQESSTSSSAESPNTYRDRISRISFSYPRRSSSSAGQSGQNVQAAHPYALYQQTTFEEPEEIEESPQPVPVGFFGRPTNGQFRRRTGPEGEELDIIGPDGHPEQLPPYTRYPMAGPIPGKSSNEAVSPLSTVHSNTSSPLVPFPSHSTTNSPIIPFTSHPSTSSPVIPFTSHPSTSTPIIPFHQSPTQPSPLIHQESIPMTPIISHQAQPFQESTTPVQPYQNHQLSSRGSGNSRGITSSASSLTEVKPDEQGSLKKKKKKQKLVCGVIPLWALLCVGFLAILLAIVAGGVLGGLLSQRGGKAKEL